MVGLTQALLRCSFVVSSILLMQSAVAFGQDPIPDRIRSSGLQIELIDIAQLPQSRMADDSGGLANTNFLVHANDGSGRVFVNDMRGQIFIIENDHLIAEPFLDLSKMDLVRLKTNSVFQGFTTFAFHPDYGNRNAPGFGKLYTATDEIPFGNPDRPSSREPESQHSVLTEWSVDRNNPNRIDPNSRRELWRLAWPSLGHKMDQLAFNPNAKPTDKDYGMLYLSLGDGGDTFGRPFHQVDVDRNGQNTQNLFGTIARIDPLGSNGPNGQFGIPADNPYLGNEDFAPEIWAFGFRNPHRFSWDRIDWGGEGTMLIADIGQASIEEVSIGTAGGNYGWSEREGSFVVNHNDQNDVRRATQADNEGRNFIDPVIQYDHSEGRAIVGGYVMRGDHVLNEKYIFGDLNNGRVFSADLSDLKSTGPIDMARIDDLQLRHNGESKSLLQIVKETVPRASRADLRFGQGPNGELYVLTKQDGFVRRLNPLIPGDFDANHVLDADDLNLLSDAIIYQHSFDLNNDGLADASDRLTWIRDLKQTWIGDANLDGEFNSNDLVQIFAVGEYEDDVERNSFWEDGDWTGDKDFDSSDLVLAFQDGGYERGPRVPSNAVPEPRFCWIKVLLAMAWMHRKKR